MTVNIIASACFLLPTIAAFIISYRQHKRRGFVFTNTWVWATKEQRKYINNEVKNAEYRLARNVFFILACAFFMFATSALTRIVLFMYIGGLALIFVAVYAIVMYTKGEKQ